MSEHSVGNWKRQFLEADKAGLATGKAGPSTREQQLEAEVTELTQALGQAEQLFLGEIDDVLDLALHAEHYGVPNFPEPEILPTA